MISHRMLFVSPKPKRKYVRYTWVRNEGRFAFWNQHIASINFDVSQSTIERHVFQWVSLISMASSD